MTMDMQGTRKASRRDVDDRSEGGSRFTECCRQLASFAVVWAALVGGMAIAGL